MVARKCREGGTARQGTFRCGGRDRLVEREQGVHGSALSVMVHGDGEGTETLRRADDHRPGQRTKPLDRECGTPVGGALARLKEHKVYHSRTGSEDASLSAQCPQRSGTLCFRCSGSRIVRVDDASTGTVGRTIRSMEEAEESGRTAKTATTASVWALDQATRTVAIAEALSKLGVAAVQPA
jgi:hypothetical protein